MKQKMCCVATSIVLAFALQASANELPASRGDVQDSMDDFLVDNVVSKLVDRVLQSWSLYHSDADGTVDGTTLGKPVRLASPQATITSPFAPHPPHPSSLLGAPHRVPTPHDSVDHCQFSVESPCMLTRHTMLKKVMAPLIAAKVLEGNPSPSIAASMEGEGEVIGNIQASGLVFKDEIYVQRILDPKVSGVSLYQTDFSKAAFDKIKAGNLLQADPGASALACTTTGPVMAQNDIVKDKKGEEIYSEKKALLGKTLKVRRVYDEKLNNIVYVVYTERLNKDDDPNGSRFKTQTCAIHLNGFSD